MQTDLNDQFEGAFFELYLHALFRRLGYQIEVHPEAGGSGKRPDFRMTSQNGESFFCEGASVGQSRRTRAQQSRINDAYNAMQSIDSPEVFLVVEHFGVPETPVPLNELKKLVERFLAGLDYEQLRLIADCGDSDLLPSVVFDYEGLSIKVSAFPKSRARRGSRTRQAIGARGPGEAEWIDDRTPIHGKIKQKAHQYGELGEALLIAINGSGRHLDDDDHMEILFGQETIEIQSYPDGSCSEPIPGRKRNGVWRGPEGPQNRRVSAVLFINSLLPWTVGAWEPTLYHHPEPRYHIAGIPDKVRQGRVVEDYMRWFGGVPSREFLSVPDLTLP